MAKAKAKKIKCPKDTSLEDFWKLLPEGAEETLLGLAYNPRKGEVEQFVPGVGTVVSYVDACSEGEDRGGYVKYARLLDVLDSQGRPVVLEGETDGCEFMFEPRTTILY